MNKIGVASCSHGSIIRGTFAGLLRDFCGTFAGLSSAQYGPANQIGATDAPDKVLKINKLA